MYLNNKSYYTLLGSANKPQDIIDYAYENKLLYIGICDVNTIEAAYSFIDLAKKKSINPIIAVDTFAIYNKKVIKVILIAKNNQAFIEINKIITDVYQKKYENIESIQNCYVIIQNYDDNLEKLVSNNEHMYFGITSEHILNEELEIDNKYILVDSVYFPKDSDFEFYRLLLAIKDNIVINKVKVDDKRHCYFKSYDVTVHPNIQKVKENMDIIAASIKYNSLESRYQIPVFDKKIKADEYLEKLALVGLNKRLNGNVTSDYMQRLRYELGVIFKLNFADYFLVVFDIVKFCKQNNIYVGPGRGSAAASLVSYALGITNIDPIEYSLIFERFLNVQRLSMPDIDIDIEDTKREEVVQYVYGRYGEEYACKIGTLTTFQSKSSFREIATAFNVDKKIIAYISKELDSYISFTDNMKNKKIAKEFMIRSELKYIYDYVIKLQNFPKNRSIHAAGIIISPHDLYNYTAFENEGVSITSAKELESQGLVKFDLLALSNLRFLHSIVANIKEHYDLDIDINNLNLNDDKVFQMLSQGLSSDVFQFESHGIRETLKKYKPENFMDLATILALYRPGPMKHIDDFINRKNNKIKYDYYFPELKSILSDTYGIIIYQEQIMQIVQIMAGYSYAKADIFRRVISKKDGDKLTIELNKFKVELVKKGYQENSIVRLLDDIKEFASYGFNKAHAVSYANISYAICYLKVNYPLAFYQEVLSSKNTSDKLKDILSEIQYLKLRIKTPDIKRSMKRVTIIDNYLQLGFENIKMISQSVIDEIIEKRSNSNDQEVERLLVKYVANFDLTDKEVENMIFSGLFSEFGYNEKELIDFVKLNNQAVDVDVFDVFTDTLKIERKENYDLVECEKLEFQALDMNLKYQSIKRVYEEYQEKNIRLVLLEQARNLKSCQSVFKVNSKRIITTKNNETMCFLDVSSYRDTFSIVVFPKVYYKYEKEIENIVFKLVVATISKREDSYYLESIVQIY